METWTDFVEELTSVASMRLARVEAIHNWGGDIPITLLFACFGRNIAQEFDRLSQQERTHIFATIEKAMMSSNVSLRTLAATGLLEALSSKVQHDALLTEKIIGQLGEASLDYWRKWTQWDCEES